MSTTAQAPTETPETPPGDERLAGSHHMAAVLRRPEVGAAVAALAILIFFAATTESFKMPAGASTWIFTSSSFGIMAVAVALLMIGGEFDLSAGAMVGTTGLTTGILMTEYGLNVWISIGAALALAVALGVLNGVLVMRTGLPSFIVTLGTFFVLQGCNLAVTKLLIGKVSVTGFQDVEGYFSGQQFFGSFVRLDLGWLPWVTADDSPTLTIYAATFWWVAVTALATWVLLKTRAGNWIFAVGGAQTSARQVGVPVFRTKVGLFVTTAVAGWLVGMLSLFKTTTVQSTTGVGQEFIYIICAVVGGCLLTGGYGSAVGAALGALIYGMVGQGIVYQNWDNDWLYAFLGVMLLGAVLVNNWVKARAEAVR
ncbi:MAG TPA: ABC transporter permease [Nocardioidaceae bacterium]|nr:ABC transporter permease [Nocardioidaceae bacterium]